jgi:pyruvate/2-oxoglutarate dehydrogenase complex dihydrolipoamide acyltransferase (E2) component
VSYEGRPMGASRRAVNALLGRARRFHCSVSGAAEYDVTDLLERLRADRAAGRDVSLTAVLVKATGKLLEEQPALNRHLFTGLFGRRRIVEFRQIHCTLAVARDEAGAEGASPERRHDRELLVPLLLRDVNLRAPEAIEAEIRRAKAQALTELEPVKALSRLGRLPDLALDLFSYKARSDPDFYLRHFGTYGLSSLVRRDGHGISLSALANTGVAFLPGSIRRLPRYVGDELAPRQILSFAIVFDHYLFDGREMLAATERLGALLETPELLLGKPA